MTGFDLQTTPKQLSVAPGTSGTIVVVVSNRLGRPVMGRVDHVITPPAAAAWVTPPAEPQRRFDGEPSATHQFEFVIQVPEDAETQSVTFRADASDVLAPDDHFTRGETVAIEVTAKADEAVKAAALPWWVWLVAGLVVLGAGAGIFFGVIRKDAIHAQGTVTVSADGCADLDIDDGAVPCTGDAHDLRFAPVGRVAWALMAQNGAQLALMSTSPPGKKGCESAEYISTAVPGADLSAGAWICVLTSDGRHAEAEVRSVVALGRLQLQVRRGTATLAYRTFP